MRELRLLEGLKLKRSHVAGGGGTGKRTAEKDFGGLSMNSTLPLFKKRQWEEKKSREMWGLAARVSRSG